MDVMVHIHGGAFMFGGGESYPSYILQNNDIVYVSINYRLGILGEIFHREEFYLYKYQLHPIITIIYCQQDFSIPVMKMRREILD